MGLLKVTDVAKELNVGKSTVYNLIDANMLKHHRIGLGRGGIRISRKQLDEFLKESEMEPGDSTSLRQINHHSVSSL